MARRVVESEPTGETFVFDDDWNDPDGRVGRLEFTVAPRSRVPPHLHPGVAETFAVVSGVLSVRIGERTLRLGHGERAATKPGEVHSLWNEGTEPAHVIGGYNPPIAIEPYFTAIPPALASKNPLKIAVLWAEFNRVTRPGTLPRHLFVTTFAAVGRLFGLGGWYRQSPSKAR
jgi:mannose-6-phosphate isomerase-like protein (cupin superfamily)